MEALEDSSCVQEEDIDDVVATKNPPSFKGRLNLAEYSFSPKPNIKDPSHVPEARRNPPRSKSILTTDSPKTPTPSPKRRLSNLSTQERTAKKSRSPSGYAPPTTYAHLQPLPDVLEQDLICVFVGLNPGIETSVSGHAYAHPSNLFWKLLHSSGCTTRRCRPQEDQDLPRLFALGNTNIVARPTRNGSELSKAEMDASVHVLEEKIRKFRPEAVCIVGKGIWESIWRVRHHRPIRKDQFKYGWQDEEENMGATGFGNDRRSSRVFVATSTSGLAASLLPAQKEEIWRMLGVWVEQRREERAAAIVESSSLVIS